MKYFELYMREAEDMAEIAMCGKGERVPTVEEANVFYHDDVESYGRGKPIAEVCEISEKEAAAFYDVSNVEKWAVFGK